MIGEFGDCGQGMKFCGQGMKVCEQVLRFLEAQGAVIFRGREHKRWKGMRRR